MMNKFYDNLDLLLVGLVMNGLLRSRGIVIVDNNHLLSSISSRRAYSTPFLYCIRCTEDISPEETVITPTIESAYMAAIWIDIGEINWLTDPVRA